MARQSIDWTAIEAAWREGGASARAIGRRFGIGHGAVLARARREGWVRGEFVAAAADPAPARARVVAAHRVVIEQGQILTQRLLEEVLAASARIDALAAGADDETGRLAAHTRAATLAKRIAALRDLAQAARLWIALEREAWGLKDNTGDDDTPDLDLDAALALLAPEERTQLRRIAEIVSGRSAGPAAGP
ncbi:hypothetical protein [Methylobacterium nodulans]|uniref:Uncharacterized protein n=1 Tax=Methylobacterium nodulans (strain LMG 21967 / CNCM I-2342 / ORS 2060) TaxID=460265 RepID=B8IDG0_METNO|nr:hypothetical protein [Methylobacterium nodulans]ACL61326.1 conserved hypothetical protein [Methylobacterium nodulans ORS 2060]